MTVKNRFSIDAPEPVPKEGDGQPNKQRLIGIQGGQLTDPRPACAKCNQNNWTDAARRCKHCPYNAPGSSKASFSIRLY